MLIITHLVKYSFEYNINYIVCAFEGASRYNTCTQETESKRRINHDNSAVFQPVTWYLHNSCLRQQFTRYGLIVSVLKRFKIRLSSWSTNIQVWRLLCNKWLQHLGRILVWKVAILCFVYKFKSIFQQFVFNMLASQSISFSIELHLRNSLCRIVWLILEYSQTLKKEGMHVLFYIKI